MEFKAFRQSGELSDITVIVNKRRFQLHKFPLYAKSDFFKALARSAMVDKDVVELKDFPGDDVTFSLIADFCYNMDIEVSPKNVAQLRCAAEYLQMTTPGNLVAQTDEYLQDVLFTSRFTSLDPVVQVFKSCCALGPLAEQANITGKCIKTFLDVWATPDDKYTKKAKDATSDNVLDNLVDIPLYYFMQLLISARDQDIPKAILATIANKYLSGILQSDAQSTMDADDVSVVFDSIVLELPNPVEILRGVATTQWVIDILNMAWRVQCKSLSTLLQLASRMIGNFAVRELTQMTPDLLSELVQYALSVEMCIPDVICDVIDRYLYEIASAKTLSVETFVTMATLPPVDFRSSHDLLFQVVELLFKSGSRLSPSERSRILDVVDFRRLSEDTLRRAYDAQLVPLSYITKASLALCTKLRADLETARNTIRYQEEEFQRIYQCANLTSGTWIKDGNGEVVDVRPQSRDKLVLQLSHIKEKSPVSIEMTHEFIEGKLAVCALSDVAQTNPVLYIFNPFKSQLIEVQSACDGKEETFKVSDAYRKFETGHSFWPYSPKRTLNT
ncbi:uncharacterized protein LOC144446936 [Glandiceps talaboti]